MQEQLQTLNRIVVFRPPDRSVRPRTAYRLLATIEITLTNKANHSGKANARRVTDALKAALQPNATSPHPTHAHAPEPAPVGV